MKDVLLSPKQAWGATWDFLRAMLEKCPNRFLNQGRGYMMFENFLDDQLSGLNEYVWRMCYSAISLKPCPHDLENSSIAKTISSKELFGTIIAVICEYCYLHGFRMFEFIALLQGMKCSPEQYPKERRIWDEAVLGSLR